MTHIAAISWYIFSDPCLRVASEKNEVTSAILSIDPGGVAATFLARSFEKYQMAIRKSCSSVCPLHSAKNARAAAPCAKPSDNMYTVQMRAPSAYTNLDPALLRITK